MTRGNLLLLVSCAITTGAFLLGCWLGTIQAFDQVELGSDLVFHPVQTDNTWSRYVHAYAALPMNSQDDLVVVFVETEPAVIYASFMLSSGTASSIVDLQPNHGRTGTIYLVRLPGIRKQIRQMPEGTDGLCDALIAKEFKGLLK